MSNNIFKQAKSCINKTIIEHYFSCSGAKWKGSEYWTLNPLRNDKNIGSFHISNKGLYVDHVDSNSFSGDIIDLLSKRDNISKLEAAKIIIEDSGGMIYEKKIETKKDKIYKYPKDEDLKKLNKFLGESWIIERYGKSIEGYEYKIKNKVWCCVVRFETERKKNIVPFYWNGTKWNVGNPIDKNRPLYNIDSIGDKLPILIVEGERCANVQVKGFVVTTWIGGTGQIKLTNFDILKNHKVYIWPDAFDETTLQNGKVVDPGKKAAKYIKSILPQAKVLDVWDYFNEKK